MKKGEKRKKKGENGERRTKKEEISNDIRGMSCCRYIDRRLREKSNTTKAKNKKSIKQLLCTHESCSPYDVVAVFSVFLNRLWKRDLTTPNNSSVGFSRSPASVAFVVGPKLLSKPSARRSALTRSCSSHAGVMTFHWIFWNKSGNDTSMMLVPRKSLPTRHFMSSVHLVAAMFLDHGTFFAKWVHVRPIAFAKFGTMPEHGTSTDAAYVCIVTLRVLKRDSLRVLSSWRRVVAGTKPSETRRLLDPNVSIAAMARAKGRETVKAAPRRVSNIRLACV